MPRPAMKFAPAPAAPTPTISIRRRNGATYTAEVLALVEWRYVGGVTASTERAALAKGHRVVAALLDAAPDARWNASADLVQGWARGVQLAIRMELAEGDAPEADAAEALLRAMTATIS